MGSAALRALAIAAGVTVTALAYMGSGPNAAAFVLVGMLVGAGMLSLAILAGGA